jgi:hypothetical protein
MAKATKLTDRERAVLAAAFAVSNMGQPRPAHKAVQDALTREMKYVHQWQATTFVVEFGEQYMETDEHLRIFEDEAQMWWRTFKKRGQDTREYVQKTWLDMAALLWGPFPGEQVRVRVGTATYGGSLVRFNGSSAVVTGKSGRTYIGPLVLAASAASTAEQRQRRRGERWRRTGVSDRTVQWMKKEGML